MKFLRMGLLSLAIFWLQNQAFASSQDEVTRIFQLFFNKMPSPSEIEHYGQRLQQGENIRLDILQDRKVEIIDHLKQVHAAFGLPVSGAEAEVHFECYFEDMLARDISLNVMVDDIFENHRSEIIAHANMTISHILNIFRDFLNRQPHGGEVFHYSKYPADSKEFLVRILIDKHDEILQLLIERMKRFDIHEVSEDFLKDCYKRMLDDTVTLEAITGYIVEAQADKIKQAIVGIFNKIFHEANYTQANLDENAQNHYYNRARERQSLPEILTIIRQDLVNDNKLRIEATIMQFYLNRFNAGIPLDLLEHYFHSIRDDNQNLRDIKAAIDALPEPVIHHEGTLNLLTSREESLDDFLNTPFTKQGILYGLNSTRSKFGQKPNAPIFHPYHGGGMAPFFAKLPNTLLSKIPVSLLETLHRFDLKSIDLYFVPQSTGEEYAGTKPLLRPHHWCDPDMPQDFNGGRFYDWLVMGVYPASEGEFSVEKNTAVTINRLSMFEINVHDGLLSPDNAEISCPAGTVLWSVTIDYKQQKAAVTLHWILSHENARKIREKIDAGNKSLIQLMNALSIDQTYAYLLPSLRQLFARP